MSLRQSVSYQSTTSQHPWRGRDEGPSFEMHLRPNAGFFDACIGVLLHGGAIRPDNLSRLRHTVQMCLQCNPFLWIAPASGQPAVFVPRVSVTLKQLGRLCSTVQLRLKMQPFG